MLTVCPSPPTDGSKISAVRAILPGAPAQLTVMTFVVCRLRYQQGVYPICGNSDLTQVWVTVSPNE
jgi:hypothetical protein